MSVPCKVQARIYILFKNFSHPPIGSTTMSLGRSRFSHIRTVRMLPSALETSMRSVPEKPNTQHDGPKSKRTRCHAGECVRNTVFYVTTCETRPFTSISPVELAGHPVNRQACWALQTGVHYNLDKRAQQRSEVSHFIMRAVLSYLDL